MYHAPLYFADVINGSVNSANNSDGRKCKYIFDLR